MSKDLALAARRRPRKLYDSHCDACGWSAYGWTTGAMAKFALAAHDWVCPKAGGK